MVRFNLQREVLTVTIIGSDVSVKTTRLPFYPRGPVNLSESSSVPLCQDPPQASDDATKTQKKQTQVRELQPPSSMPSLTVNQ